MFNCIFSACFICFLASLLTCVEMNKFRNLRDIQKVLLRFRSVRFFRLRGIRRSVLHKFIELCLERPAMLASLWGTQIWRPETNRNIAIKRVLISGELINIKLNTYSKNKDCSGSKILKKRHDTLSPTVTWQILLPIIVASRNILEYSNVFCHKMKDPFELKLCRITRVQLL